MSEAKPWDPPTTDPDGHHSGGVIPDPPPGYMSRPQEERAAEEEALVQEYREGSQKAVTGLLARQKYMILGHCNRAATTYGLSTGDPDDREQLFQAAQRKWIRALEEWDPDRGASFSSYAWTVVRNVVIDEAEKMVTRYKHLDGPDDEEDGEDDPILEDRETALQAKDPHQILEDREVSTALERALGNGLLTEDQRQAVLWTFPLDGSNPLTVEEIADRLDSSWSYANAALHQGLATLRTPELRDYFDALDGRRPTPGEEPVSGRRLEDINRVQERRLDAVGLGEYVSQERCSDNTEEGVSNG